MRLANIEFPVDVGNEDPALVTHFVMRGYLRTVLALGSTGSEVCEWRRALPPGSGHISLERGGADPKGNRCCFQLPCRSRVCSTTLVVSLETMRSNKVPRGWFQDPYAQWRSFLFSPSHEHVLKPEGNDGGVSSGRVCVNDPCGVGAPCNIRARNTSRAGALRVVRSTVAPSVHPQDEVQFCPVRRMQGGMASGLPSGARGAMALAHQEFEERVRSGCAYIKEAWLRRYGTITYLGLVLARQDMQDGCKVVDRGETPLEFISKGGRLSLLESGVSCRELMGVVLV